MRILSVSLKNIKSHQNLELNFVNGINVLSGVNGVGKSTVFEAIGYALFGVDARDFVGNIDRFITIGEKKGEIAVTFETDTTEIYRASRTVGSGSKWLLAAKIGDNLEIEDHSGAPETEARIKELLKLDSGRSLADQFKLVIGPFQNDFLGPFVIKQPTRRQETFDEILGIDAWRKTFKGTSGLYTVLKGKIDVVNTEIGEKKEQTADLPKKNMEHKDNAKDKKERKEQLQVRQSVLSEITGKVKQFEQQKEKLDTVRNELKQIEASIHSGTEYIASQKLLVKQSEEAVKQVKLNLPGKEAYQKADKCLHNLRQKEQQRRIIEKEITNLEKNVARLTDNLVHETKEIEKIAHELNVEEKQLVKDRKSVEPSEELIKTAAHLKELKNDLLAAQKSRAQLEGKKQNLFEGRDKLTEGTCPFFQESCLNIAGKESRDVFATKLEDLDQNAVELEKKIEDIAHKAAAAEKAQKEIDVLHERSRGLDKLTKVLQERQLKNDHRKQKIEKLQADEKEARKELSIRKKDLDVYAKLDEEISLAQKEKQKHLQARDDYTKNQQAADALPQHSDTLKKYKKRLVEHEQKRDELQNTLQKLNEEYKPKKHEQANEEKEGLLSEVAKLKEQIENLGKEQQRLENEIHKLKQINKEIELRRSEKKVLEEKKDLVIFLRNQIFKNVSVQLSERFREEVTLRADRIYRTISETDEELYWGDKYRIVLRDMQDGKIRERSDDQLSGGQTMSAVVALRLALLQTIGARIAFFDEPTSNLDAARRENLAHAFRAIDVGREEVTEHWYDQLFLISHDVAFTEVTDQVISLDR